MNADNRNTFPFKSNIVVNNQKESSLHPCGKIILTNGRELDCYPLDCPPSVIKKDELALDTTGEYLRTKQGGKKEPKCMSPVNEPWRDLFFKEAFSLYEHREAIFSDSRMFLTPLPFKNNLAFTGTSGLQDATLGIYLEWWETCEQSILRDKDGNVSALTYLIAGSPMSGSNHCSAVRRDGRTEVFHFAPFSTIWGSFMSINTRYTEAKQIYRAYTLEETIEKLKGR